MTQNNVIEPTYQVHDKILSKEAIRKGIWQAIKTKTNYDLSFNDNSTITGGVFVDSIWLKENYSNDNNISIQNVIGKIFNEDTPINYVTADLYNMAISSKKEIAISINDSITQSQLDRLGIPSGTTLNKLPVVDAKSILKKLIYEDAKLLSLYNNALENEIIDDFMIQKLFLSAYDIIAVSDNTIPVNLTSTIYTYDDNVHTNLNYSITNNAFTIQKSDSLTYTYYPEKLIIKTPSLNQRYTVTKIQENETTKSYITAINENDLTEQIEIDFDYKPEYTITIIPIQSN